jgi:hypothetical protein
MKMNLKYLDYGLMAILAAVALIFWWALDAGGTGVVFALSCGALYLNSRYMREDASNKRIDRVLFACFVNLPCLFVTMAALLNPSSIDALFLSTQKTSESLIAKTGMSLSAFLFAVLLLGLVGGFALTLKRKR